jgi:hypothetical protein
MYNCFVKKAKAIPSNVAQFGHSKTKSGKIVTTWKVTCISCGRVRVIKRADHASRHSQKPCKFCSNKNNHPQGEYRGIRVSFAKKYELQALSRSRNWSISIDDMADVADAQERKCAMSGVDLVFTGDFNKITASLDRIDNSKGYEKGNIQWVHKEINMMKGILSVDRFIEICKAIADRVKW